MNEDSLELLEKEIQIFMEEKKVAFFDDLGKKISQAGQTTVQKTRDMADVAKINMQISDEEKKINDTYLQIGKLYMELHASDSEEAFQGMVQTIVEAQGKIKEYKAQIQEIKGVVRCEKCGAEVSKEAVFCPVCGVKMPEIVSEETEKTEVEADAQAQEPVVEKKCANCGAVLGNDALFCSECGTKVE